MAKISPRVTRIVIIDDDESARNTLVELVQLKYPMLTVRGYGSIFEAYQGLTTYDYMLIDVSSVAPQMLGDVARAWAPISKYAEQYPATNFIIVSAASRNCVNDVIDDCVEQGGIDRRRFTYGGFLWESRHAHPTIEETLNGLIKPDDLVWTEVKSRRTTS